MAICLTEDIPEMWLKGKDPLGERGCPDKWFIHDRDGFFKNVTFSLESRKLVFLSVEASSQRRKLESRACNCEVVSEQGKKVIPPWGRAGSSHLSSLPGCWGCRSCLTNVQQRCDSRSADRAGSHPKLHRQTGKSRVDWMYFLRKEIKKVLCSWRAVSQG